MTLKNVENIQKLGFSGDPPEISPRTPGSHDPQHGNQWCKELEEKRFYYFKRISKPVTNKLPEKFLAVSSDKYDVKFYENLINI